MAFFDRFNKFAIQDLGLREEVFLQFKVIHPSLLDCFLKASMDLNPIMGLARVPGEKPPPIPTLEELKPIIEGKKKFIFNDYVGDYCYWFLDKSERQQRELFMGHAGLTIIFLKPDPNTSPPPLPFSSAHRNHPIFAKFDVDRIWAQMNAIFDSFPEKSKRFFGDGLEQDPQFKGLLFILPLLKTADFFTCPPAEVEKWFEFCDIYINESLADKGILLASKLDFEEEMIQILRDMAKEGMSYSSSD